MAIDEVDLSAALVISLVWSLWSPSLEWDNACRFVGTPELPRLVLQFDYNDPQECIVSKIGFRVAWGLSSYFLSKT